MPEIISETGCFEGYCPLGAVIKLYRKMEDAFFLIVGTRTCHYGLQGGFDTILFSNPRFGSAVLEESDLGGKNPYKELSKIIKTIVEDAKPAVVYLLATCSSEILKMDLEGLSQDLEKEHNLPILPVRISGLDNVSGQGEGAFIMAMANRCSEGNDTKKLLLLGSLPAMTEKEIVMELKKQGIERIEFLPPAKFIDLPCINENTIVAPLFPHMNRVCRLIERTRGSKIVRSMYPVGPEGTKNFIQNICEAFGIKPEGLDLQERESWKQIEKSIEIIKDKKIFILGEEMSELPIARFLKNAGAIVLEVGTAYIDKKYLEKELDFFKDEKIRIVERPDFNSQFERIKKEKPDLIIAGYSLTNSLEAHGFTSLYSTLIQFYPVYGFSGVPVLAGIFSKQFRRKNQQDKYFDKGIFI